MDFAPKDIYKTFRVNKELSWLINKRKKGLIFRDPKITSKIFFNLILKSKSIERFGIRALHLYNVTTTEFDKCNIVLSKLKELDLLSYKSLNEPSLMRLVNGCKTTL